MSPDELVHYRVQNFVNRDPAGVSEFLSDLLRVMLDRIDKRLEDAVNSEEVLYNGTMRKAVLELRDISDEYLTKAREDK